MRLQVPNSFPFHVLHTSDSGTDPVSWIPGLAGLFVITTERVFFFLRFILEREMGTWSYWPRRYRLLDSLFAGYGRAREATLW